MSVTDAALARAVVYNALSLGFQMPTAERLRRMGAGDRFATVVAALQELGLETASGDLHPEEIDALTASFVRLFGHTTRGLVCACETEYGNDNQFHQPQQLADIAGYYLAFGLKPVLASDARADHVACQCEFMDFLNRKEALLLAASGGEAGDSRDAGDDATLEVTRAAARTFLRDHLGYFGRAFATRLMVEDADGLFGWLGAVLRDLLDDECRRLAIAGGPVDLIVRPEAEDDTPMACGTGSELIQIQRRP
ncbi:MAG: molecular chaperone TorD family protein [Acidobacteria bacterium]|nr:molecular chaperone TorD family protein [Acidobacteriota bacterium]